MKIFVKFYTASPYLISIGDAVFSQTKITNCVVEADALYNFFQGCIIVGIFAVFHPIANEIAQNTPEIIMPRIAQEGTGIGEHAHKIAQYAKICQRLHLLFHPGLGIVEPPG